MHNDRSESLHTGNNTRIFNTTLKSLQLTTIVSKSHIHFKFNKIRNKSESNSLFKILYLKGSKSVLWEKLTEFLRKTTLSTYIFLDTQKIIL